MKTEVTELYRETVKKKKIVKNRSAMIRVVINKKNANEMSRYFVPKLFIISRLNRPVVSQYIYTSRGRIHWKLTDLKIPVRQVHKTRSRN